MEEKRIRFKKGQQKLFISYTIKKLGCPSLRALLRYDLKVPYSTLKKYYQERYLMPLSLVEKLCLFSKINLKSLNVIFLPENWGAVKGGKKGIVNMMEKYKSKLKIWRAKANRNSSINNTKKISYPELNEGLAELIGAHLGDGTMTNYFIRISGDYRYDLSYFHYLSSLIFKLFGVQALILRDKRPINTFYLLIASKNICSFLKDNYNISYGHKIRNKTSIPKKILEDKKLSIACLRGLIDTDGSVSRRGRRESQFCVQFTYHNIKLLKQVYCIGKKLKLFTYMTGHEAGTNKWENILKYFKIVGSSNLKHIIRFCLRYKGDKSIYLRDTQKYYKKDLYRNMSLPFRMDQWSSG